MTIDEAKKLPCPHYPLMDRPHCMTTRCPHWERDDKGNGYCLIDVVGLNEIGDWVKEKCGMSEEWNEIVKDAQAHIATKDKLAELTVENETLRNRCAELSTEVVSAWGQNGMLKEKHNVVKRQRDIYRKNWQEYKYIKFELEGHSGWLFKQNEELKQAGDEMAKRLCQIINSEKFSDDASVSAVALWFKAKGENSNE